MSYVHITRTPGMTLADYRTRYNQYRRDPDVQAMHAALPIIGTLDDHEFARAGFESPLQTDQAENGDVTHNAAPPPDRSATPMQMS